MEAIGSVGPETPGLPKGLNGLHPLSSYSPCPRIEEETESQLTEQRSKDSVESLSLGSKRFPKKSLGKTDAPQTSPKESDPGSRATPGGKLKPIVKQFMPTMTEALPTEGTLFDYRQPTSTRGRAKESLQSADTQDGTPEVFGSNLTTKKSRHTKSISESWTFQPQATSKNNFFDSIKRKLKPVGVGVVYKTMYGPHKTEEPAWGPNSSFKRSFTKLENKSRGSEPRKQAHKQRINGLLERLRVPESEDKTRILETLGVPKTRRRAKSRKEGGEGIAKSFDNGATYKRYSESCVFSNEEGN